MRILLIEDDSAIGKAVRCGLLRAAMTVDWVEDGAVASAWLVGASYDAVVLDLGLPNRGGLQVLEALRAARNAVPVLIITARSSVPDRIAGLDAGADDYLVKPFDLDELAARVRALGRRRTTGAMSLLECGALTIDPRDQTVSLRGEAVDLSAREFKVLQALMRKPGAVVSRAVLEQAVYGWDDAIGSNVIEVHLHRLRRKLGADVIKNIRGVGYKVASA